MNQLLKRLLVAAVLIPLLILMTFWQESMPFKFFVLIVLVLCFLELGAMAKGKGLHLLFFSGLFLLLLFWVPTSGFRIFERVSLPGLLVFGIFMMFAEFIVLRRPLMGLMPVSSTTFFCALYLGILGSYFLLLRRLPDGPWHLLVLFLATWSFDTGGFFIGGRWGRHKMTPTISPKKSWEGFVGGILFASVALVLLWKFAPPVSNAYRFTDLMILAVLLSIVGQAGDLVESMMKRSLSAKDSGSLLPGHGGVFDRIDSLLFNAPVLFYYIILILPVK